MFSKFLHSIMYTFFKCDTCILIGIRNQHLGTNDRGRGTPGMQVVYGGIAIF